MTSVSPAKGELEVNNMGKKTRKEIERWAARKSYARLQALIERCLNKDKPFWRRVAELLARPRRQKVEVNVSKIERFADQTKIVVVPGKVLGDGEIKKKVKVAAFQFSNSAKKKLEQNGSTVMNIEDVLNEDVKNMQIIV